MGNRSNINLVGNTTQGQNLGAGEACVFKEKVNGNTLQFRTISATGDSIQIIQTDEKILISGATGGGSGSGLTTALNGLTDDGTNVCLGGTLSTDTDISGNQELTFGNTTPLSGFGVVTSTAEMCMDDNTFSASTTAGHVFCMWDLMPGVGFPVISIGACGGTKDAALSLMRSTFAQWSTASLTAKDSSIQIFGCNVGVDYPYSIALTASANTTCYARFVLCGENNPSVYTSGCQQPINYAGDYSSKFTDNSLITKAYLAAHTGGTSGGIGWSNLTNGSTVAGCGTIASGASTCNTFYGVIAGKSITTGARNVSVGYQALSGITIGNNNIAIGYLAQKNNANASNNVAIGLQSLEINTLGCYNVANGNNTLSQNTSGCENTAIGSVTLFGNTSGCRNVGVGFEVLRYNNTGNSNVGIGYQALHENQGGNNNVGISCQALYNNQSGSENIAIGYRALCCGINNSYNIALGYWAMGSNTGSTVLNNIGIGTQALCRNTGYHNLALGGESLKNKIAGNYNVAVGNLSLYSNTGSTGNVAIGVGAGYNEQGSNKLHIANCCNCSLIYGEFDTKMVKVDGCMCITNLPNKTTETCGIYIDANGKLSKGVISGGTGGGLTTALNGLSANTTTVVLGGNLIKSTDICTCGYNLVIYGCDNLNRISYCYTSGTTNGSNIQNVISEGDRSASHTLQASSGSFDYVASNLIVDKGNLRSQVYLIPTSAKLAVGCIGGSWTCFTISTGSTVFTDAYTQKGIQYAADYSANYTDRSLIDKGYFAAHSGGSATSYWTKTGTNLCPATAGDDILLPAGDKLRWSDNSCVTSAGGNIVVSGTTACISSSGESIQLSNSNWIGMYACTTYFGASSLFISQTSGSKLGCLHAMNNWCINLCGGSTSTATAAGTIRLLGGDSTSTGAGGDVCIEAGSSSGGAAGRICLPNLPTKTTETCGIYIDANGKLSKGVISGGTGGTSCIIGWTCLTSENVSVGCSSMPDTTSGSYNTAVGVCALQANTTGNDNTAIGVQAMYSNTGGIGNAALGDYALYSNTNGDYNIAIGSLAMELATGGNDNIGIGFFALCSNTTGNCNIGVGRDSLAFNDSGCFNVGIGWKTLINNTSGSNNVAIGNQALCGSNSSGANNVGIGECTLFSITNGYSNIAIGYQALLDNTTGTDNNALGWLALSNNISGKYNTAIGNNALFNNTIGCHNIAMGIASQYANTGGSRNISFGCLAMCKNTYGCDNIAIGDSTLFNNIGGSGNIAIGCLSLHCNTGTVSSGFRNIALGVCSLYSNTTGNRNVSLGTIAMWSNKTGCENIAMGTSALYSNCIGLNNIAIGCNALVGNDVNGSGCNNIAIGTATIHDITSGNCNIAIGFYTSYCSTTGYENIAIGKCALHDNQTGVHNVAIGCGAGQTETGSNKLYIAYSAGTYLVKGDFAANTICRGGNSPSWDTTSDARVKENVITISCAINTLIELNPVLFDYTEDYSQKNGWNCCQRICNYGFVAQEFEQVFPKYVTIGCEKIGDCVIEDFRSINDGHLVPLLVKAIQEQQVQINNLCEKIIQLGG